MFVSAYANAVTAGRQLHDIATQARGYRSIGSIRYPARGEFPVGVHSDVHDGRASFEIKPCGLHCHRGSACRRRVGDRGGAISIAGVDVEIFAGVFARQRYFEFVAVTRGIRGRRVAEQIVIALRGNSAEVTCELVSARRSVFAAGSVRKITDTVSCPT